MYGCKKDHGVTPAVKPKSNDLIVVTSNGSTINTYSITDPSKGTGVHTMTIPFAVTPVDKTAYIPAGVSFMGSGSVEKPFASPDLPAIEYVVDNGTSIVSDNCLCIIAKVIYTGSDNINPTANGNYKIPLGKTMDFKLVITYPPNGIPGSYRGQLVSINANTNDSPTSYKTYTEVLKDHAFKTSYVAGQ